MAHARSLVPDQEKEAVQAYKNGSTLRTLAGRFECSEAAIRNALVRCDSLQAAAMYLLQHSTWKAG